MWKFHQSDSKGVPAEFENGVQIVTQSHCPPLLPQMCNIFSQAFTIDGTPTASKDMGIDGSATPVDFYIEADKDTDIYIARISFVLGYGASSEGFEFADSGSPLTNGLLVSYTDTYGDEVTIMNPKANYSFMRASGLQVSNINWEERGFAATGDYGYFVNISLKDMMPPFGVKLDRGTIQRMTVRVRDNCSSADLFNCQAFGFKRLK